MSLDLVFWGFTLYDLLLAFGRFLIAVSGTLLVFLNTLWLARRRYRLDKRAGGVARATMEAVIGATLAIVYGRQVFALATTGTLNAALPAVDALVVVWAFAGILTGLLISALSTAKYVSPPHPDEDGDDDVPHNRRWGDARRRRSDPPTHL